MGLVCGLMQRAYLDANRSTMLLLFSLAAFCSTAKAYKAPQDGYRIFINNCAGCHRENSGTRAPLPAVLAQMPRETIVQALETGLMKAQGAALTDDEKKTVAAFLARHDTPVPFITTGLCSAAAPSIAQAYSSWNGWGAGPANTRFQPAASAGLSLAQVSKLEPKWAFGFPEGGNAAQPTVAGNQVFVGSPRALYALDAHSGCVHWIFKAASGVRAAASVSADNQTVYFADNSANAYALNTVTGALIWKVRADEDEMARVTAAPLLMNNRLYISLSSGEEGAAINPYYECCKFRGKVVALNASSGAKLWTAYAIPTSASITGKNARGITTWGPAGAAIWSAPTMDERRHVIYVATGNSYSDPDDTHSDAVIAFDSETGRIIWSHQFIKSDRWNLACLVKIDTANCPQNPGDDYDFGASPILASLPNGREVLLASQKSGMVYALDPDQEGRTVWQKQLAKGGPLGGIEWGGAVMKYRAYYPLSDWRQSEPKTGGGLAAVRIDTGEEIWRAPAIASECGNITGCSSAQIAPVTAIPGAVFSGSMDGHLRAYDAENGKIVWDFNTAREFQTIDNIQAHGGSLNAGGAVVAAGMVYLTSGQQQGMPGNVLLAFSVSGQ